MGYYSRFTLHAIDPVTSQAVPLGTLPSHYFVRVQDTLETAYGSDIPLDHTGRLFHGEATKFYDHPIAVERLSKACPEVVWVIHGIGEDSKEWAVYAYRGVCYTEEAPPWAPPPPNFDRLPLPLAIKIPPDPPTAAEVIRSALQEGGHGPKCVSLRSGPCTCWRASAEEALKAMEAST